MSLTWVSSVPKVHHKHTPWIWASITVSYHDVKSRGFDRFWLIAV
jgi:hypothetical protein